MAAGRGRPRVQGSGQRLLGEPSIRSNAVHPSLPCWEPPARAPLGRRRAHLRNQRGGPEGLWPGRLPVERRPQPQVAPLVQRWPTVEAGHCKWQGKARQVEMRPPAGRPALAQGAASAKGQARACMAGAGPPQARHTGTPEPMMWPRAALKSCRASRARTAEPAAGGSFSSTIYAASSCSKGEVCGAGPGVGRKAGVAESGSM